MDAQEHRGRAPATASRVWDVLPYLVTVACVCAFSFLSGGYIFARSAPVAIVYLVAAAVWAWFLRRRSRPSPLFLAALAAYGAFVVWAGLSVLWSFGPDLSWVAFDVAALYAAVLAVVGLTPAGALQLRAAAVGYLVVALAVGIYALLGKVVPDVVTHAHMYARLDSPVGYWNVLALMMALAIVIGIALAGDRHLHGAWRAAAAAACVPISFAYFFTLSRGGWIALVIALLVYFAFTTTRLAGFASLAAVLVPVAAVVWKVRGLSTLFTATTDDALRTAQGHVLLRWVLLAVAAAAVLQLIAIVVQRGVSWPRWVRIVAGATVVVVLVGGVSVGGFKTVQARGGSEWLRERARTFVADSDSTLSGEGTSRLVSLNTGRVPLWKEAVEQSRSERTLGTGAGTFVFTNERFSTSGGIVKHAHSQWFNVLSELGVVGLVLFVVAVVLVLAAAIRNPFRDRGDPLRPLVVALQAGAVAFVVHMSWDWDWDMAAVGVVFFLFVATCSSYLDTRKDALAAAEERRPARPPEAGAHADDVAGAFRAAWPEDEARPARGEAPGRLWPPTSPAWRVAGTAVLVLLAVSWLYPYLAARAQSEALALSNTGDLDTALTSAQTAVRLNPLSADYLITEALILQKQGRNAEALATLRRAQRLQPDDFEAYYQEGLLQLRAFERPKAAVKALRHALALNPLDVLARQELEIAVRR